MLKVGQRVRIVQSINVLGTITKVGLREYEIKLDAGFTVTEPWWNVDRVITHAPAGSTPAGGERMQE